MTFESPDTPRARTRTEWRQYLREQRRVVSNTDAREAAEAVAIRLASSRLWDAEHIGLYLRNDGEIDPSCIAEAAREAGKHLYLPVTTPEGMQFCEWRATEPLRRNRYGIGEPTGEPVATEQLQLIVLPTVGWTVRGFRLGMGGGFYDRFLAGTAAASVKRLGLAYDHQRQDALEELREAWDQSLDAVLTESTLRSFAD